VAGETLVGRTGRIVTAVRGGSRPGEVRVVVDGIPHYYLAFCAEPLSSGAAVLIINSRGSRQVDVEPWIHPGADSDVRGERS
jgi:membrane protein implicated in regulation of membrane protease activity